MLYTYSSLAQHGVSQTVYILNKFCVRIAHELKFRAVGKYKSRLVLQHDLRYQRYALAMTWPGNAEHTHCLSFPAPLLSGSTSTNLSYTVTSRELPLRTCITVCNQYRSYCFYHDHPICSTMYVQNSKASTPQAVQGQAFSSFLKPCLRCNTFSADKIISMQVNLPQVGRLAKFKPVTVGQEDMV